MGRISRFVGAVGLGILLGVVRALAANDPGAAQQWNMALVGAEAAWATGTGRGITVAVVDTGVHLTHEDLAERIVPGWDFVGNDATPQDDNGHGTHVAGIVAAVADNGKGVIGVAPDVKIMPVKVLNSDGRGSGADVDAGIRWAANHGAHVINLSLGEDLQGLEPFGPSFVEAIEYAWGKGAVCVVAAGNDTLQSSGFNSGTNAVVVTATTRNDTQAGYASDVGLLFDVKNPKWGMAAPGGAGGEPDEDDILSTYWTSSTPNAYAWAAGTSMATPHVSGAVAILRSLGLSKDQAADRVTKTAKDLGAAGKDSTYGWGRLDVAKAVAGLQPAGGGSTPTTAAGGTTTTTGRTTTTTARSGRSGLKVVTPTTEGTRNGAQEVATTTSATGSSPTLPGDEVIPEEEEDEKAAAPPSASDSDDTVWPAALLALLALAAAGAGLRRARRV